MNSEEKRILTGVSGLAVLIIVMDQLLKYWVRVHIGDGPNIQVTNWFYLCFVQNNGMAFGITLFNKIFLTLFRVVAVAGLIYLICYEVRKKYSLGFVVGSALILGGATGNIIDCLFYGVLFNEGAFCYGKVVDMFYFPLIQGTWPDWFPFWSGEPFVFFRPVFNLADSAITCGVFYLLIFKNKELARLFSDSDHSSKENKEEKSENDKENNN